jgi:hypothetical protein
VHHLLRLLIVAIILSPSLASAGQTSSQIMVGLTITGDATDAPVASPAVKPAKVRSIGRLSPKQHFVCISFGGTPTCSNAAQR